jgi:integral membrane sensor domain MASE1
MKFGKFTVQNRRWYYNEKRLQNPIVIVWKALLIIPIYAVACILGVLVALFDRDIESFSDTWDQLF